MVAKHELPANSVKFLTDEEWMRAVEEQTRALFDLSVAQFVAKVHEGGFGDPDSDPDVMRILMQIPPRYFAPIA